MEKGKKTTEVSSQNFQKKQAKKLNIPNIFYT